MNDDELRRAYQRSATIASPGAHPEPERLAALVDGEMQEAERLTVLEHVLRCPTCKPELELLRAASEGARAAERRVPPMQWMAIAAAALLLVGVGVLVFRGTHAAVPVDVMRGGHAAVSVIEPATGTTVAAPVQLAWHAMAGARSYRVELLTTRGEVVGAWTTADTTLAVADSVHVSANGSYDMWVRAMLADRTEVSSPLVRFTVKP
jgi:anti-sigma factor ChrR (cupin superfamily)